MDFFKLHPFPSQWPCWPGLESSQRKGSLDWRLAGVKLACMHVCKGLFWLLIYTGGPSLLQAAGSLDRKPWVAWESWRSVSPRARQSRKTKKQHCAMVSASSPHPAWIPTLTSFSDLSWKHKLKERLFSQGCFGVESFITTERKLEHHIKWKEKCNILS